MACELRLLAVHVHGHEAEIDAFFDAVESALAEVEANAPLLWPGLTFINEESDCD